MPTILYVDDQPAMARAVKRWLGGRGTGVHAARTIAEAKQSFAAGAYDGAFIDLWLNDGSGFELFDWIVEHRPSLSHRVAFVTADFIQHGAPPDRFRLIDRPVFVKPFDLAELDRCVDRWVGAPWDGGPRGGSTRGGRAAQGGGTAGGEARTA
jgi:CheY-like chemotaxis protein